MAALTWRSTWSGGAGRSPSWCLRGDDRPSAHAHPVRQADSVRMGQANVKRWVDDILPLLTDDDPLGVDAFATHHLPLEQAPRPT